MLSLLFTSGVSSCQTKTVHLSIWNVNRTRHLKWKMRSIYMLTPAFHMCILTHVNFTLKFQMIDDIEKRDSVNIFSLLLKIKYSPGKRHYLYWRLFFSGYHNPLLMCVQLKVLIQMGKYQLRESIKVEMYAGRNFQGSKSKICR